MNEMPLVDSLEILRAARTDEAVVTAMGVAREWMALSEHPLDFNYVPSSMGQASSLGLGIALGRPERRVVVCNGDGSTLMNLGSLVTITAEAPPNLVLLVFDNGVYEVTGGQVTPASAAARRNGGSVDLAAVARACGFERVYTFATIDEWRNGVDAVLAEDGPVFALLKVAPEPQAAGPKSRGPAHERAAAFGQALNAD